MKTCSKCGVTDAATLFRPKRNMCLTCFRAQKHEYWKINAVRINAKRTIDAKENREHLSLLRQKPRSRFTHGITQAKERGLAWTLTFDEYLQIYDLPCYYCNNELCEKVKYGTNLDRIDNDKGYHVDNVLPCGKICNQIRMNILTVQEAKAAVQAVVACRRQAGSLRPVA